ncbi:MAG: AraC family transcriptional regulator [Prochlorococcaceae cyanobacterium]
MRSSLQFGCIEQMTELLEGVGLPLRFTQLASGALRGDLVPLAVGPVQILRVRADGALHASGSKPGSRQLICLDLTSRSSDGLFCSHGHWLPSEALFGLRPHSEIHLTIAARCDLAIVSINQNDFQSWAEALGCPGLEPEVFEANWVRVDPRRFDGIRAHLRRWLSVAEADPEGRERGSRFQLAMADLVPLIVEALAHGVEHHGGMVRPPSRTELVMQAQRWMDEHPFEPISLDALCRQVYASRRTLIQGFRDHLGMGPMAYLKLQRLHAVRRQLLRADPDTTVIADVATSFGFHNPGHFARDYRQRFGELPSTTLAIG